MLDERMEKALNEQINKELFSAYLYQAMGANFDAMSLSGFANWMKVQAQEEQFHASKFYDYIYERGGRVRYTALETPQFEWDSALAMYEAAYEHETFISASINNLLKLAREIGDYATENFLQWFVAEQVEEEASADELVQQLRIVGDSGPGLFMINREVGARSFSSPE